MTDEVCPDCEGGGTVLYADQGFVRRGPCESCKGTGAKAPSEWDWDADPDFDLSSCPYYIDRDKGSCVFSCRDEPACITDRPRDGWPSERAGIVPAVCESCGEAAEVRIVSDGSAWCRSCDDTALRLGYDDVERHLKIVPPRVGF